MRSYRPIPCDVKLLKGLASSQNQLAKGVVAICKELPLILKHEDLIIDTISLSIFTFFGYVALSFFGFDDKACNCLLLETSGLCYALHYCFQVHV